MARIAWLGLGVMGAPMAGHLAARGHELVVYNRTPAKAEAWAARHGGRVAASPAEAARGAAAVMSCVGADADLEEVLLGPAGALGVLTPGALIVDHTTVSATIARRVAERAATRGVMALDAPVSGGEAGAVRGELSVMAGGSAEAFAAAEPLIAAYARRTVHIGPAGHGQLAKMVNQVAIAGLVQGLAEALAFGAAAGLDMERTLEAVGGGAAASWQMHNRARTMLADEFDFGFAVAWMRKDLGLALCEARANGAPLPVAALVDQFYAEVEAMGGARWDTSSLIRRLRRRGR